MNLDLPPNLHNLLQRLRGLLEDVGGTRFLHAPLVRANSMDFPDPWRPTLENTYNLIYQLLWHSYIDAELVILDERIVAARDGQVLTDSSIDFSRIRPHDGALEFTVMGLGNDDVAGALSHQLGSAYLAMRNAGGAFRAEPRAISDLESSLAAYLLGLGIVAANSASYVRKHAELLGNSEYSEYKIAAHGALTVDEAGFLLMVQDVVRDESHSAAFATLRGPQKEAVDLWRAELLPHRRELRELLGLAETLPADALATLSRPAKARTAPAGLVEPDPRQFNRGHRTFRVLFHRGASRMFVGWLVGGTLGGIALNQWAMVWPLFACLALGGVVGWGWGRRLRYWECSDPHCGRRMNAEVSQCPGCGGAIAAEISSARLRLAKEEELDLVAATDTKRKDL